MVEKKIKIIRKSAILAEFAKEKCANCGNPASAYMGGHPLCNWCWNLLHPMFKKDCELLI